MTEAEAAVQVTLPSEDVEAVDPEQERFEVELEFVQCLASPSYLHCTSMWERLSHYIFQFAYRASQSDLTNPVPYGVACLPAILINSPRTK